MEIHKDQLSKPNRDTTLLAPIVQNRFLLALCEIKDHGLTAQLFEGYRSPARQQYLYDQGRLTKGTIVTKAKPFQSFHQYGLAMDLAFKDAANKWYWPKASDPLWDRLQEIMERFGFEALSWERPHFQLTGGMNWQDAKKIHDSQGLLAVWDVVSKKY